jgi:imidazolonepropionase-like amidohydrolase
MKKLLFAFTCLVLLCGFVPSQRPATRDVVITNARILDGTGAVIPRGSVVARNGRIVSVSAGPASEPGRPIDAKGMTLMAGFIDDHRHVIGGGFPPGDPAEWLKQQAVVRMQEFLEGGFTTIQSCGDPVEQIVELQRRLNAGEIKGPRLFTAAFVQLARPSGGAAGPLRVDPARIDQSRPPHRPTVAATAIPDDETRASVRKLKQAGIDVVKTAIIATPGGAEEHTLSVVADEARKVGMPVFTHAVTVEDTLAAVRAHPTALAHTPHIGQLTEEQPRTIANAGIPMMSTLGIFLPAFAAEK